MASRLEVLLFDSEGARLAWFTSWERLVARRVVNGLGGYTLQLGGSREDMIELRDLFARDYIVEIWRQDAANAIAKYKETECLHLDRRIWRDEVGWHFLAIGAGFNDLLARTHVQAAAGTADSVKSGAAETVLKAFCDQELGPGAGARARADVTIEADGARGNTLAPVNGFNTNLLKLCQTIAEVGGGDFDLVGTGGGAMELRWYDGQRGTDRRGDILFASAYGNLVEVEEIERNSRIVNAITVLGQGEGADRERVVVEDAASIAGSKWGRVEMSRDARDLDDVDALEQRGELELQRNKREATVGFQIRQSGAWLYGRDYGLGDLVRARVLDTTVDRKIVTVEITAEAKRAEQVTIGTIDV